MQVAPTLVPAYVSAQEGKTKPGAEEVPQKSRAETALSLMGEYGSCCSGVLGAYAPEFGLESGHVAGLGRGMAGGIGGLERSHWSRHKLTGEECSGHE